ncbi:MAG: ADP-glyceromanno-heptose 6-epimerase [Candidatus Phaeomarinobacter sp.]
MIVVTGGAGFIGSNILAQLSEDGQTGLVVCDWLETDDKWRNIAGCQLEDVIAPEALFDLLHKNAGQIDAVIHMGAISSTTETDVDLIVRSNIRLTIDLWDWCVATGTRLIYASSAATYGDGDTGFDDDLTTCALALLKPLYAYGWSKHFVDQRIARHLAHGGATPPQWSGLKFFNVYGPNEYHKGGQKSVVAHIHPDARGGGPVKLFKSHNPAYQDGGQLRDFVYVKDCAKVVSRLLDTPSVNGLFNLGTGEARSFKDLATAVFAALNRQPNIEYVDTPEQIRDKYQYFTQARMARLRAAGYTEDFTSLEDGVADYVRTYLEADDSYR